MLRLLEILQPCPPYAPFTLNRNRHWAPPFFCPGGDEVFPRSQKKPQREADCLHLLRKLKDGALTPQPSAPS